MIETNKIYCMDNVKGMKTLPDNCIDLTVTSPPYDNLRTYKGFSWDFKGVANELFRITKQGGVVVWIVADSTVNGSETGTSFTQALYFKEIGFNLHDTMIWEKNGVAFPDFNRYYSVFEYMFILSKGKPSVTKLISDRENKRAGDSIHGTDRQADGTTICNSAVRNKLNKTVKEKGVRYNVWQISPERSNSNRFHPAMFPEALANDHIISWSKEGDVVLDPFLGSGTTAKMALKNRRKYIGFDISEEYCKIAEQRIFELKNQLTVFDTDAEIIKGLTQNGEDT